MAMHERSRVANLNHIGAGFHSIVHKGWQEDLFLWKFNPFLEKRKKIFFFASNTGWLGFMLVSLFSLISF